MRVRAASRLLTWLFGLIEFIYTSQSLKSSQICTLFVNHILSIHTVTAVHNDNETMGFSCNCLSILAYTSGLITSEICFWPLKMLR